MNETAAGRPLLSVVLNRTVRTKARGDAGFPSWPTVAPLKEDCGSVWPGTGSCRTLVMLSRRHLRRSCERYASAIVAENAMAAWFLPESKNDCASPGEVVVYQPERRAVNQFVRYLYRIPRAEARLTVSWLFPRKVAAPCWSRRLERTGFGIHLAWFCGNGWVVLILGIRGSHMELWWARGVRPAGRYLRRAEAARQSEPIRRDFTLITKCRALHQRFLGKR